MNLEISERTTVKATSAATMRAAVLTAPRKFEIQEVEKPAAKAGQLLVRLEGCGVCASSLPLWEGREWFRYPQEPGAPGHEGWGVVENVGRGAEGFSEGDRVAFLSNHAFAEYESVLAEEAIKLPGSLEGFPFPGEPLGCAMNIFHRSDIVAGQTVAIVGIGFLGVLLVQLAKAAGVRVIALSQREHSLALAKEAGADEVVSLDGHHQVIETVKNLTSGSFCERVIEATGKEWPLNIAGELTAVRGKLIIAGYHQDGMRQVNIQLWNWRGLDVINAHERDSEQYLSGMQKAIEAVKDRVLNPFPYFSPIFDLTEIEKAFTLLEQRPNTFVKALIITIKSK